MSGIVSTRPVRLITNSLLLASLSLGLVACSSDMGDLQRYIDEVRARPAQAIEPIPPVKTYSPYAYDGEAGRDPFRTSTSQGSDANPELMATGNSSGPRPDFDRTKEYLERFELDTLDMVGTFANEEGSWGLLRDPDGVVHRVSVENYVGKNHGKIVAIRDNEIIMSELISDGAGGWLVREASVALDAS
jgi:type IV pilus assembly protein PilP